MSTINSSFTNLHEDPKVYADWYLRLGFRQKKIIQFLYHNFKRYGEKNHPSIAKIAKFANCTERHVKKFFSKCRWLGQECNFVMLKITPQYKPHGEQTTNQYKFNNYFKCALNWLETFGYLNAPFHKIQTIIVSMEKLGKDILKFTPKTIQSSPNNDSSLKGYFRSDKSIKEYLRNLPIKDDALIFCSQRYSDYILNEAKRSTLYAIDHNMIKKNKESFFIGSCKKIDEKVRRRNLNI